MAADAVDILNQVDRVTLIAPRDRIVELPEAHAAFATRGGAGFAELLRRRFAKAGSADEIAELAPMTLRAAQHALQVADAQTGDALTCRLSLVGWGSEGPIAFTIATDRFRVTNVPFLHAAPQPDTADVLDLVAGGSQIDDAEDWRAVDTESAALRLVAARPDRSDAIDIVTIGAHSLDRRALHHR